jgi:hypothetical protein
MWEEKVEVVRGVIDGWVRGDSATLDLIAENLTYVAPPAMLGGGIYHGHEGVLQWIVDWRREWTDYVMEDRNPPRSTHPSKPPLWWAAVLTSAPQPLGAAIAYLLVEKVRGLLAVSFAFAAGAMLALVATDLLPRTLQARTWRAVLGLLTGAAIMLALSAALGV